MNAGLLADAVSPVRGLVLGGQIPPGVIVNDHIRRCQVQPGTAGLQRNQEHLGPAAVKTLHQLCPLLFGGVPLEGIVGDSQFLQPLPNPAQHGGELGEEEDLVSIFHHPGTQLQTRLQLA